MNLNEYRLSDRYSQAVYFKSLNDLLDETLQGKTKAWDSLR